MTVEVPDDCCGFTLEREFISVDISGELDEISDENWYVETKAVCCCRETWAGHNRCIWHTDIGDKEFGQSGYQIKDGGERLDGAILREARLEDKISFAGSNLTGADLSEVNLANADLNKTNLTAADLWEANLSNADLREADFTTAEPWEADLSNADLREADLLHANLWQTTIADADIREADFSNATLWLTDLSNADIRDADFTRADLTKADFSDANLTNADFWYANLTAAKLTEANLSNAFLADTDLTRAEFANSNLTDAKLVRANLSETNFREANLTDANLSSTEVENIILERANLTRTNIFNTDMRGSEFYGAILSDLQFNADTKFGAHYTHDEFKPDKAAWSYRQIERLFQQNALGRRARAAKIERRDVRRREQWGKACVPEIIRDLVWRCKFGYSWFKWVSIKRAQESISIIESSYNQLNNHLGTPRKWIRKLRTNNPESNPLDDQTGVSSDGGKIIDTENENSESDSTNIEQAQEDCNEGKQLDEDISVNETEREYNPTVSNVEEKNGENSSPKPVNKHLTRDSPTEIDNVSRGESFLACIGWTRAITSSLLMRYGESPWRVIGVSMGAIFGFGLIYPYVGGMEKANGDTIPVAHAQWSPISIESEWLSVVLENIYFSAVTFTTLGYGDIQPGSEVVQFLASVQSFLGALLMALLVFVLGRRTTW